MTPLYDVMSLQPTYGAHQLTRRHMKMAMAVGRNRRYGLFDIAPRHFLQTAEVCGMGDAVLHDIFAELKIESDQAIEATLAGLPVGFPVALAESIIGGFRERLRQLER